MPSSATTGDEIFGIVRRNLVEVLPGLEAGDISLDARMSDLGASSLDRVDVVAGAMHDLGIEVAPQRLARAHDIRSLVDVLFEELACARQPD